MEHIAIGKYTIEYVDLATWDDDNQKTVVKKVLWISKEGGQGGNVSIRTFIRHMDKFYHERF